jgi:hypothetical protein
MAVKLSRGGRRVVLATVALLLTACDGERAQGFQQIGVTLDSARNAPEVLLRPCPGDRVRQVSLWLLTQDGSDRERRLWSATATAPAAGSPADVVVGARNAGFREDQPLQEAFPAGRTLEAVADIGIPVTSSFDVDELDSGSVVVDPAWYDGDRHVSAQRFADEATKQCDQ